MMFSCQQIPLLLHRHRHRNSNRFDVARSVSKIAEGVQASELVKTHDRSLEASFLSFFPLHPLHQRIRMVPWLSPEVTTLIIQHSLPRASYGSYRQRADLLLACSLVDRHGDRWRKKSSSRTSLSSRSTLRRGSSRPGRRESEWSCRRGCGR